jgi:hypothetical protein
MEKEKYIGKKSIFRQLTYAKRYLSKLSQNYINGQYRYGESYCYNYNQGFYTTENELVKDELLYECNLELPMLEVNEKFYISELNLLITVKECYRTSDETVVYYIEDKNIEDGKTTETQYKAKLEIDEWNNVKELNKKIITQEYQIKLLNDELVKIKNHRAYKKIIKSL